MKRFKTIMIIYLLQTMIDNEVAEKTTQYEEILL